MKNSTLQRAQAFHANDDNLTLDFDYNNEDDADDDDEGQQTPSAHDYQKAISEHS